MRLVSAPSPAPDVPPCIRPPISFALRRLVRLSKAQQSVGGVAIWVSALTHEPSGPKKGDPGGAVRLCDGYCLRAIVGVVLPSLLCQVPLLVVYTRTAPGATLRFRPLVVGVLMTLKLAVSARRAHPWAAQRFDRISPALNFFLSHTNILVIILASMVT